MAALPGARASAGPPSYIGPLVFLDISVAGHNMQLGLDENAQHTGLVGTVGQPLETSAESIGYLLVQQCTDAESGCVSIPSSVRSYPSGSTGEMSTASVTPAAGHTYRFCAFVTLFGQTGGGCTPIVFPGGQAFLGDVSQYVQPGTGRIGGFLQVQPLNGQLESLLMDIWICKPDGTDCSVVSQRILRSIMPPQPVWGAVIGATATHGHAYKTCALLTVQGVAAAACTPLEAF